MRFADLPETFRSLAERTGVPGAQLTLHRAGETVTVTCGRPALTGAATVGPRTMFPLGSVTKTFTATVAVQLVADGDAEFDAPLSEYLGELAGARSRALREVTLRQALSHTGGVISDFELDTDGPVSPRRYVQALLDRPDVWRPGTAFSYSNTGYVLAGHLVERLTGMDWWETVDSFVNAPLGLDVGRIGDPAPGLAVPHVPAAGGLTAVEPALPAGWEPAGGLAATSEALVRFALAHLDGKLVPAELAAAMREPVAAEPFGVADGWGLGWALYDSPDGPWYGHDGTLAGSSCSVRVHAPTRTAVALLANGSAGLDLWTRVAGEIGVGAYRPPRVEFTNPPDGREFLGDYYNDTTCFTVSRRGHGELGLSDGTGLDAVLRVGDCDLVQVLGMDEGTHVGRFLRAPGGEVAALQFSGRIARLRVAP
ncbi:serine hydrolase domain-containing protein [Amycolatopsis magusensis]|uniref:serine hydrolase domain-containing protein n=1 Tax=Amycolatopsis magusensis TaxID=882444 RepID=UPI0037AC8895